MSLNLDSLITVARQQGASDLHLEPGLPAAFRVRGALRIAGEPVPGKTLVEMAHGILGAEHWPEFVQRRSFDLSRTVAGTRCRINLLHSARGVGLAIRILSSFQTTIERLNLHPELKKLVAPTTGLILISGATGSGKSSTLAALIQEINLTEARHILTVESPIEYTFRPRRAYIRQREVGRDTPSFEQALVDAMREDPDVLMVGEMRDPETMRLTLNAAETGHLVLATMHSGTCIEAVQRLVMAFPPETQAGICAQLADCLVAVVCQRLRFRADLNIRVPECEILRSTVPVKALIRSRELFRLNQALETGAEHGMWTFDRYAAWLAKRTQWHIPTTGEEEPDSEPMEAATSPAATPARLAPADGAGATPAPARAGLPSARASGGPIEIEPVEGGLEELLRKLK
jgi:twitching motility protein PilT